MENRKSLGLTIAVLAFFLGQPVCAYDGATTHRAVTTEAIKVFEHYHSDLEFATNEEEVIIDGSEQEDAGARPLNHFYDPVHNKGLYWYKKSPDWGINPDIQGKKRTDQGYYTAPEDYSWERAIYEYVYGDKSRGLRALGQVIHLVEDKAVPDHTRLDNHYYGSPYESYAKRYTPEELNLAENLISTNRQPVVYTNLYDYFNNLAAYSNKNFFSQDTIFDKKFSSPTFYKEIVVSTTAGRFIFGYHKIEDKDFKLVRILKERNYVTGEIKNNYEIDDKDKLIFADYWSLLSEQAVLHSAGVMKLFFDEVEEEKRTHALFNKNQEYVKRQNATLAEKVGNLVAMTGSFLGLRQEETQDSEADVEENITREEAEQDVQSRASVPESNPAVQNSAEVLRKMTELYGQLVRLRQIITSMSSGVVSAEGAQAEREEAKAVVLETARSLRTGGSSAENNDTWATSSAGEIGDRAEDLLVSATTSVPVPIIISPAFGAASFATTTILFSGTASSGLIIFSDAGEASTTATSDGTWELALEDIPEGTSTIRFFAMDAGGNESDSASIEIAIDLPKVFSFSSVSCSTYWSPLLPHQCYATSTVDLSWNVTYPEQVERYEITGYWNRNDSKPLWTVEADKDAVTMQAKRNNAYYFQIKAYLLNGSSATSSRVQVISLSGPAIAINEIAWQGTASSSRDEWIELYNNLNESVDLSRVRLERADGTVVAELEGDIKPHKYYLIERGDDDVVKDVSADLVSDFGVEEEEDALPDAGFDLRLVYPASEDETLIIDQTPDNFDARSKCRYSDAWCAEKVWSIDRIDTSMTGTTWWMAGGEPESYHYDRGDNPIMGTPREYNQSWHTFAG